MNLVDEPVGENCISGGIKIESGIDSDGNGTLDESEGSGTNYVCNGVTPADEFSYYYTTTCGNDTDIDLIGTMTFQNKIVQIITYQ